MTEAFIKRVSFARGEVSPTLHARDDLAVHQIGLAKCENFVALLEGGLTRRPGTRFVMAAKNESESGVLIPRRLSGAVGDSYALVINGGVMRVIYNGGVVPSLESPFELPVPWGANDLAALRYAGDDLDLYAVRAGYAPRVITRVDHDNWSISNYLPKGGPVDVQNVDQGKTIQASAVTGTVTLTANSDRWVAADVGSVWRLDEPDLTIVPTWIGNEDVTAGGQRRNGGRVYEALNTASSGVNAPTHDEGEVSSGEGRVTWRYLHNGHGFVRISTFASPTSVTAEVLSRLPDSVVSQTTYRWWSAAWSDAQGWPETVRQSDERLLLTRGPDFWMSRPGFLDDMEFDGLTNSALAGRLRSPDGSSVDIIWGLLAGILVVGGRDGEWIIRAPNATDALTIGNIRPIPDDNKGSSPHIPVVVDGGVIFIGRSRRRLHFCEFNRLSEKLEIRNITISARHILRGRAVGLAYQRDPNQLVWVWCENGALVSVTFMPEQDVLGFARHPLRNGYVESMIAIPSSDEGVSEVYLFVRRIINGQTRRYVEQLVDFFEPADPDNPTAEGAWFVDCGLSAVFDEPVTTISGFDHLEGEEIAMLVNGRELPRKIVAGGQVVLDEPIIGHFIGGLPIDARVRLLPQNTQEPARSTKGRTKRASELIVDVVDAAGGEVSCNGGPTQPLQLTGAHDYGAPIPLQSGSLRRTLDGGHDIEVAIEITCHNALPFTLLGASPNLDVAED